MSFDTINHCRFCGDDSTKLRLFKYSVRHYTCATCGFRRWGLSFLDRIPVHEVGRLPYLLVQAAGLTIERLEKYRKARRAAEDKGGAYTINQALAS